MGGSGAGLYTSTASFLMHVQHFQRFVRAKFVLDRAA